MHSWNKSASQWKDWQILRFLDASCTQMYSQMICSVLSKWQFYFYLSAHSDFGFFSCVGYLHPKLHIKGVKSPFLNFVGYMKHRLLLEGLLKRTLFVQTRPSLSNGLLPYCPISRDKPKVEQKCLLTQILPYRLTVR